MAQKRMFDKKVVGSDKFIELPNSTKALYFMAGMEADDKGFFQPRKLQRMCGFSEDDFKLLIAKRYFIAFESGVMVVTDWNKNNWLDSRRITETEYVDELKLLKLINQKYEFLLENGDAKQMLSQNRIEENRIEYNIYAHFEQFWKAYPKKVSKQKCIKWFEKNKPNEQELKIMLNQLERFKQTKDWQKENGQFIPYPDTWLRNRRWEDEFEITNKTPKWLNEEIKDEDVKLSEEELEWLKSIE